MSGLKTDRIHPLTLDNMRTQHGDVVNHRILPCGCQRWRSGDGWYLCTYHQGFDEGVTALLDDVQATGRVIAPATETYQPDNHPAAWVRRKGME